MAFWLGLMRLAERSGLVNVIARVMRPVLRRLFPEVPAEHPAWGSMVMNITANMLGLTNAATPLGLRAMRDLETLNLRPGTATNAMCTFLAINTSSVQLLPVTAIAILAAHGSTRPTAIVGTAFIATLFSTFAGIVSVKTFEKLGWFQGSRLDLPDRAESQPMIPPLSESASESPAPASGGLGPGSAVLWLYVALFIWFGVILLARDTPLFEFQSPDLARTSFLVRMVGVASILAIPFLAGFFPLFAALRRVPVYDEFVEGAKEGFNIGVRIIPYLVAMLVAIGMFRGAGGIELLSRGFGPLLSWVGFPPELLPMALVRPLSGSGSMAVISDLARDLGPDHLVARMAATIFGSTETTFYVVAVYFGSVGIRRTRHAIPAGLLADAVGVIASVMICRMVFE
jgi:spore maturation protein SpmA